MNLTLNDFSPRALFLFAEQLSKVLIFGSWTRLDSDNWVRIEPGRRPTDSRAGVWLCGGQTDLEAGWHFRIGFGVAGLSGLSISSQKPSETAELCMARVDEILSKESDVYLANDTTFSDNKSFAEKLLKAGM